LTHLGRLRDPRALPGWIATTAMMSHPDKVTDLILAAANS
jgi:hypothetical protein